MLPVTPLSDFLPEDSSLAVGEESGVKFLLRPLLAIPRADIEAYCAAQKLTPRVDHTNFDTTYFRNRLRREVLPLLETLTPGLRGRLAHTASVIAADYDQMQRDLEAAWPEISIEETSRRVELDLAKWRAWPLALRRAAIRRAMTHLRAGLRNVGFVHVEDALKVAQTGSTGAQATLPDGLLLRVDYGSLIIGAASDRPPAPDWPLLEPGADIALAAPAQIALASGWRFGLSVYDGPRVGPGWDALLADPWCAALRLPSARMAGLRLRTRRRGDRFQPQGLAGSQKVNEFMINARIPAAWRDQLPMFVVGDQIAWLCGWRVDERFAARLEAKEVWLARFEKT
jgi:tRNA(Ile)-lysidine synthase